jgi:DNA-binding protein HU-beta
MKKTDFINAVAQKSGLSKRDVESVVDASLETITEALKNREKVSFLGFGSFRAVKKKERIVVIPKTSNRVKIPEKYSVRFKAGKLLKREIE